jgi:hypothetical protein
MATPAIGTISQPEPAIVLQPKQVEVYDLMESGASTWIGNGGGRGGAKSGGMQRIMLARCMENHGTVRVIVMRNSDQVRRYHEDVIMRQFPELAPYYKKTERKLVFPMESGPPSELIFTHAESLDDVINRFRSANFFDVAVDQAEQFTEQELREIKQAVRWPGVKMGTCKLYLAFNMGGVGIDFLRRVFHLHEFRENERREDFSFVHVRPFDNVEWVRVALEEDGLDEEDYYGWTDAQRAEFCATRSDYGKALVSQDEALVQRDFWGSWESLEGAFFGRTYDRDKTVLSPEVVSKIIKPWWQKWLSQDWGRGHYCATYWHARGEMSPEDVKKLLGWDVTRTIKVVLTYREYVAGGAAAQDEGGTREISENDIALQIVERTPVEEREKLSDTDGAFYLSPDAFAQRSSKNTIAQSMGTILTKNGLPYPQAADTDVVGGWSLMSNMLLETKREGATGDSVWLISANCAELVSSIPLLMRDPKDLDRVLKTDKGAARIEMDTSEAARYGLKSMLSPGKKPREEEMEEKLAKMKASGLDENSLYIHRQRLQAEIQKANAPATIGRRFGTIRRLGK